MTKNLYKNRRLSIDILRIVAIAGVILIHTTSKSLELAQFDLLHTPLALMFNQAVRFAVSIFFLISGFALQLTYKNNFDFTRFIRRRVLKIAPPYFFWSLFYYLIIFQNPLSNVFNKNFLYILADGDAAYHLYFIPAIAILYTGATEL